MTQHTHVHSSRQQPVGVPIPTPSPQESSPGGGWPFFLQFFTFHTSVSSRNKGFRGGTSMTPPKPPEPLVQKIGNEHVLGVCPDICHVLAAAAPSQHPPGVLASVPCAAPNSLPASVCPGCAGPLPDWGYMDGWLEGGVDIRPGSDGLCGEVSVVWHQSGAGAFWLHLGICGVDSS